MYSEISEYYDEIFPADAAESRFVMDIIGPARLVLDIGCGTGNKTELLATGENSVYAFDSDPVMVESARRNHQRGNIQYEALGMADMGERYKSMRFDALVCLGNTLVHLPDAAAVAAFLKSSAAIMADNGRMIIQILNYDRILGEKMFDLPALRGERVDFYRHYVPDGGSLRFVTRLAVRSSGEAIENEVRLLPLRGKELGALLEGAGFTDIQFYGGFDGAPLTAGSFVLIAACTRGKIAV